jgi:hypothetical protein
MKRFSMRSRCVVASGCVSMWLLAVWVLAGVAGAGLIGWSSPAQAGAKTTPAPAQAKAAQKHALRWEKITVDRTFRSEGIAVADVNRDGKMDLLVGDGWYAGPDFKQFQPIRKVGQYDPAKGYSQSFAVFADDLNGDGWMDQIVIGFPGAPCHWYENPQNQPGPWKQHEIWHSACNETPLYTDLHGKGKRVLVMGWQPKGKDNEGQMAWFAPDPADPTKPWKMNPISEPSKPKQPIPGTFKYYHGLGVGDVNGDGRRDVIIPDGWWEQPAQEDGTPWKWHPAKLGAACANMFALDLDGDGKADIISSSAHNYGIWSFRQRPGKDGEPTFVQVDLFPKLFSQSHALQLADLDGDGVPDFVTGRRFWAHGPKGDPGSGDPAVLFWFRGRRAADGIVTFEPNQIDDDSGVGTQFEIVDVDGDGLLDIVISNKKGVFVFLQRRT